MKLAYRAPYDVTGLLRFIAQRAVSGVEQVEGSVVRRTLRAGTVAPVAGWVEADFGLREPGAHDVHDADDAHDLDDVDDARDMHLPPAQGRAVHAASAPACDVTLRFAPALAGSSGAVVAAVRRWLDLDAEPDVIDACLAGLPGAPGLRLPGSLDAFELAVRAVLGQQVTVAAARTLARRVVERFGTATETPWAHLSCCFPAPATLALAPVERIAELGIIRRRAGAIQALAQAWPEILLLLAPHARAEPLIERLCGLPGIGPWTAHYIAMRALGWADAFPPNDVAVRKALRQRFAINSQRDAAAHARAWQPWRSYAVLRLWHGLETPS